MTTRVNAPGALHPDDIHLWSVALPPSEVVEDDEAWSTLDEDERRAAGRFVFAPDRARYRAAHVALRRILARYLGLDPPAVRLVRGPRGKPALDPAVHGEGLEFSLSHGGTRALVAVTRGRAVGVDLEETDRFPWDATLAARCFPPAHCEWLQAQPPADRATAFVRLWTRCEAVVKANGTGLEALPFPAETVEAAGFTVVELEEDGGLVGAVAAPGAWRLRRFDFKWPPLGTDGPG